MKQLELLSFGWVSRNEQRPRNTKRRMGQCESDTDIGKKKLESFEVKERKKGTRYSRSRNNTQRLIGSGILQREEEEKGDSAKKRVVSMEQSHN